MAVEMLTGESLFDQGRVICPKCNHNNTTTITIGSTKYHRCWKVDCENKWETYTNKK